ncbi:MAG: cation:proton antiporter [Candidatus Dormibacteraeota bacterium]|uniref:Cation:proton antiporter n=1 Tax=Candidatus Aeolococcus gillhamiae TaxID=3127015 RepID=A0A2W5Z5F1_9BACT|nr:cation:proton antiporter [Candidatus Dormibacteraeota bacterium]PZR80530.1 MAG: cation:proton antiporter [Candidatus Dormibacter sp. RRmetagenome_bin12]
MSLSNFATLHLLLALSVILIAAHGMGFLFRRARQPQVAGEIVGGLLLGPTVLGALRPDLAHQLTAGSASTTAVLGAVYQLGQLLLMYCAGAALRARRRPGEGRTTSLIALLGNVVPFAAGALFLGVFNPGHLVGTAQNNTAFLLVFCCGVAVTSIPVISRILADLGILGTSFARIVLSVAVIEDLVLYVILSIALGLVAPVHGDNFTLASLLSIHPGSAAADAYYVVVSIAAFAVPLALGRSFVERLGSHRINVLGRGNALAFQIVFMMAMTSAALFLGISPIFGAFIAGLLAGTLTGTAASAQATIQSFAFGFFIPVYFAIVGLKLDLIHQFDPAFFALFLLFACAVKAMSVYAGARIARERRGSALNLAVALNARGGPAIVLASVALDAHVIAQRFYVDLVLLALLTSMLAGAWLDRALRRGTLFEDDPVSGRFLPGNAAHLTTVDLTGDPHDAAATLTSHQAVDTLFHGPSAVEQRVPVQPGEGGRQ